MKTFNCRGYSVVSTNKVSDCFLHSEDSKVHGPRLLQENFAGTYFEKAPCLDSSFPARVLEFALKNYLCLFQYRLLVLKPI
jgi:hypothetical protein